MMWTVIGQTWTRFDKKGRTLDGQSQMIDSNEHENLANFARWTDMDRHWTEMDGHWTDKIKRWTGTDMIICPMLPDGRTWTDKNKRWTKMDIDKFPMLPGGRTWTDKI